MVNHLSKKIENKSEKENDSFDMLNNKLKIFEQEYNMLTSEVTNDVEKIDEMMAKFENEYRLIPKELEKPYSYLKFTGNLYDELTYSATLAYFLDPQKPHGLGRFVLDALLSIINTGRDVEYDTVNIDTEYQFPNGRRADIIINGETWLILIENKIWSSEGPDQTKDLYKGLQEDLRFTGIKNKYFVFLTAKGEQPSDKHFIKMTYNMLFEEMEKQGMNLLSDTPIATYVHLTDFLRTIKEEFMQKNISENVFHPKSILYIKYYDSIKDIETVFNENIKSFAKRCFDQLMEKYKLDSDEWDYYLNVKNGYLQLYKNNWNRNRLSVHFEFWTNIDSSRASIIPIGPTVAFMVNIEGNRKRKDAFFETFKKNKTNILKIYKNRKIDYFPQHRKEAIAYKEYQLTKDLNKILDVVCQAVSEFEFLVKYIDDTLEKIK